MVAMQVTERVPVGEYLSASFHPDREYLDGLIVERNLGERDHSRTQTLLIGYLLELEKRFGVHVFTEQRIQVSSQRFRIPDVCVVAGPYPDEQVFRAPPLLCIEILSKDDKADELQDKIEDYLAFGVPYVWVINPRSKRAYVYTAEGMREARNGVLRTEDPDIAVPVEDILKRL